MRVHRPAPQNLVPAVNSACQILSVLVQAEPPGLTLTELSRAVGLSKSTAHGLLATLRANGFIQREEGSRWYQLGGALVTLGAVAARQTRAATLLSERLPALAAEHGLTFALAQITGTGDAQVINSAYPPADVHVGLTLGSRYGFFDGAIGKCLLAALDPPQAERIVRSSIVPRHTDRTIVEPDALLDEIATVRARGWGASEGELKENYAVAAGLSGASDRAELILFAVGFPGQLSSDRIPVIGDVLRVAIAATLAALGLTAQAPGALSGR
jgi:DNA-binding IclR family transcriptional regulator